MSRSRRSPDRPVCFFGKVTFDFFNNDDEDFKQRSLKSLARDVRKEINISCIPVEEGEVVNPERGALVLAGVAARPAQGKAILDKAMAFLDGKAPARIALEDFLEAEIP
jgi:uncharacterized protein YlxP (DUF503 family)